MTAWSKTAAAAVAGCITAFATGGAASAAEINVVITAGPVPEVMNTLAPMFEQATGNKVKITLKGGPAIIKDVKDGANIDLIVSGRDVVDELVKDGLVAAGNSAFVMKSRVGLGVRAGSPKPDISTAAALKSALLAAKTVAYSQGASGQFFTSVVMPKLGIADAIKPKAIVVTGKPVGAAVAAGEAEIGIQQVAELTPVPGVTLVGALPADVNKVIEYSVGIPSKAKEMDAAKALVKFISSEAAVKAYKQKGMESAS
jgi:molybdate transport system substrate-binding protein